MFLKAKYTALVLFTALMFRMLFLNVPSITAAFSDPVKAFFSLEMKKVSKRKRAMYAQYHVSEDMPTVEVSEEAVEDDDNETFEKGTKYPSLLLAFVSDFRKTHKDVDLLSLAEAYRTKLSSKTYLSFSVLRI